MSVLNESFKQYLDAFLENAQGAFVLLNLDKTVVLFNRATNDEAVRLGGQPVQVGLPFEMFFPPSEQALFNTNFALAAAGQRVSFDHQFRNAATLWWTFTYVPVRADDSSRSIVAVWFMASDVTSQVQSNRLLYRHNELLQNEVQQRTTALEQQRSQLTVILDSMRDGVVFFDHRKRVLNYFNSAFAELLGASITFLSRATRLDLRDFVAEGDLEWNLIRKAVFRAIRNDVPWSGLIKIRRADDTVLLTHVTITRGKGIYTPDGVVIVFRDVSEEQRQKEIRDRFIANAAHEIRTPITALKLRTYLLRSQATNFEKHLTHIETAVEQLAHLTENMLDKTRFETGRLPLILTTLDLCAFARELVQSHEATAEQKNIALTAEVLSKPAIVTIDRSQMRQAVLNLLTNAINYTPEGGRVTLRISETVRPMPYVASGLHYEASAIEQSVYQISVEDTGIGIDAAETEFIFEPFYRIRKESQPKGHGLGLTIVKEIVESHGGQITVQSTVGVGSRFTITLFG